MLKTEFHDRFYEALFPENDDDMEPNMTSEDVGTLFSIFDEARCYINALSADDCTDKSEYNCTYQRLCGVLMWLDSTDKLHYSMTDLLGDLAVDMCLPDEIFGKTERA